jgi:selenide, water dikinase
MSPETLAQVLRPLHNIFKASDYPNLLVGLEISDDAAVYKISEDLAIIQTLDFFTPIVDDPYDYGAIAATNSMSDVYAMGGEVLLALNICGFPCSLSPEMITTILRGGAEKVREAGGIIAGGHTIDDKEPKYGLSVLGRIHPNRILTKAGAQPGDLLALTKPLGVGIITTAAKGEAAQPAHIAAAIESMKMLNRTASRLMQEAGVHACTDITGFALLGHSCEMAEKSGVQLQFSLNRIPFLDGAKDYANDWLFPAGTARNTHFYKQDIEFSPGVSEEMQQLLFTPETSGGLLIAFSPDKADRLKTLFAAANHSFWIVGKICEGKGLLVSP